MNLTIFFSLLVLMIAGCITPGPNNALLTSSGMRFGYKASIPHMLGVIIGHALMEFGVALGIGNLYLLYPAFQTILQITAITLLIWLAYKIATAPTDEAKIKASHDRPWRFWEAAAFQWINPKAWIIAIAVSGQYAGGENPMIAASFIFVATVIGGIISTQTWTAFGVAMRHILNTPKRKRMFNYLMSAMILFSAIMLLGETHAPL